MARIDKSSRSLMFLGKLVSESSFVDRIEVEVRPSPTDEYPEAVEQGGEDHIRLTG